jgi:hypothetical protein
MKMPLTAINGKKTAVAGGNWPSKPAGIDITS